MTGWLGVFKIAHHLDHLSHARVTGIDQNLEQAVKAASQSIASRREADDALAIVPHEFKDGKLIMRKIISVALLASAVGCGQSDAPTPEATTPTPQAASKPIEQSPAGDAAGPTRISPEEAVTLAKDLVKNRNYNDASKLLNEAIQVNPKLVEAYTTRASILADAKLYHRAIRDLDMAVELEPDNARFHNTRGYFHLMLQNDGPAMEDFNQAIALDPNYAQPLNNRGLVRISVAGYHRQNQDFERAETELAKAIIEFDAALRIDSKYIDALNNRGFALSLSKKYDDAIASFTQAIELNDKYVNAWNNRGQAYAMSERHDQAIADLTRAIELQPGTMEYYELRAQSYLASGHPELARRDLDHVEWSFELDALNRQLNAEPKNPQNWVARGNHLQKEARWDDALQNYADALKLDPESADARIGRASVLFHQGNLAEALNECQTVLARESHRDAHSLRGDILTQQGQYDQAIADYKAAQRFDSGVAQAYLKRSEQRKASGDIQQASADMVQAARMDPSLRSQAPEVLIDEDSTPTAAPGAFPVDAVEAEPLTPVEPAPQVEAAIEPSAP